MRNRRFSKTLRSDAWGYVQRAVALLTIGVMLLPSTPAQAWKIETHVWVAQQVLNDVLPDGKVTIPGFGEYSVDPGLWESLKTYPDAYRAGSMGPDAFPDLVGGQMTTHPGIEGGLRTDGWLRNVLTAAARPKLIGTTWVPSEQYAFAYGYLTHAASDVFGHSYINSYVGDIFEITNDQEGALRHIAVETYIKQHNPPFVNTAGTDLGKPYQLVNASGVAPFIAKQLILNPTAAGQYRQVAVTEHLALMYDFWKTQGEVIQDIDNTLALINGKIESIQSEIDSQQRFIDSIKKKKVCPPFVGCFRVYPAYCFLDPGTCSAVWTAEGTLESIKLSLEPVQAANTLTANSVRVPMVAWRGEVEEAIKQYILTSQEVAKALMNPDAPDSEKATARLNQWLCNYGGVFAAVPSEVTKPGCAVPQGVARVTDGIDQVTDSLPEPVQWLVNPLGQLKDTVNEKILPGLLPKITADIAGQGSILVSIAQLREAEQTDATLNTEFGADSSGKNLLLIADIASRVSGDMHLTADGSFDPEQFAAVRNSIVLSKLMLLTPSELNRLARDAGVVTTIYGSNLYPSSTSFNVLFDAIGSIDGNQQWQEVALPYPRRDSASGQAVADPLWPDKRKYGYPFDDNGARKGFRFWQDCEARDKVFKKIFVGPLAPNLVELASAVVPGWESVDDPFPLSVGWPGHPGSANITKAIMASDGKQYLICGDNPNSLPPLPDGYVIPPTADTSPPSVSAPPNVTAECSGGGAGQAVDLGTATAVDDRDKTPIITNNAPALFSAGNTTVIWTATDDANNSAQDQQIVSIVDRTRPVFGVLPAAYAVATSALGTPVTLTAPTAFDACQGSVQARTDDDLTLPMGTSTVIWTATDSAGNSATARQTVIVAAQQGDLNVDGKVDRADIDLLLEFIANPTTTAEPVLRDFDGDGQITDADRAVFALIQAGARQPFDLNGDGKVDLADGRVIDSVPPIITINVPAATAYTLNESVAADYACTDALAGIKSCTGTLANGAGISTAVLGSYSFKVDAMDRVDNASTKSVAYTVSYGLCLLYDPGKATKSGSVYPVKLQLCDANHVNLSSPGVVLHAQNVTQVANSVSGVVEDAGNANPEGNFRYDAGLGGYIFNLSTKGLITGTYNLQFSVDGDPNLHNATFQVK